MSETKLEPRPWRQVAWKAPGSDLNQGCGCRFWDSGDAAARCVVHDNEAAQIERLERERDALAQHNSDLLAQVEHLRLLVDSARVAASSLIERISVEIPPAVADEAEGWM